MNTTEWRREGLSKRALFKGSLVLGAVILVFVGAAAAWSVFGAHSPRVRVGTVDDIRRARVVFVKRPRAFIVAEGRKFIALSGYVAHLNEPVEFCRQSQWFEDPVTGSKFTRVGEYKMGPARRGLDRHPVTVEDGVVYFDPSRVRQGPPRGADTSGQNPEGPFCVSVGKVAAPEGFLPEG